MSDLQFSTISVPDLTKLDQLELEKHLQPGTVRFEEDPLGSDTHGDPITVTAVVVVSMAALQTLAAFLLRKHDRQEFETSLVLTRPDGSREVRTLSYKASSSEPPEAEVLEQLGTMFHIDPTAFTQT